MAGEYLTGEIAIFKRNVIQVLRTQVTYAMKEKYIIFRPHDELKRESWENPATNREFLK